MTTTSTSTLTLATIQTETGEATITLTERDCKRILVGTLPNGQEQIFADQPEEGYADGNAGVVAAVADLRAWYVGRGAWNLQLLVDWRDYATSYEARIDGVTQPITAGSLESALEQAEEWIAEGELGLTRESTTWAHGWLVELNEDGDVAEQHRIDVTIDPPEPPCTDGQEHDWQAPLDIVGGIKEAPGVHGHGGGVTIQEVCLRCGCGRLKDTWAQDPDNGRQGLESVTYAPRKYARQVEKSQEQRRSEFLQGFMDAADLCDHGEAAEQWAAFSRQLSDAEIAAEEQKGYDRGEELGREFLATFPAEDDEA